MANTDLIFFTHQKNAAFVHEAEWCRVLHCTPGETEHCRHIHAACSADAMFAVYLFSGSNRSDQCTIHSLGYQVSGLCFLSTLPRLRVCIGVAVCSLRVANVLSAPRAKQLSLSAQAGPPVLGLKSDAWKMFRLWCAADMRARARPHLQHLSHPVLLRHNTITSGIRSWRTTILDIDISTCILKLHQMYGLLKYCLYCQQGCL